MPRHSYMPEVRVNSLPVAEHRYRWDRSEALEMLDRVPKYRDARDLSPYKAGEVIYVAYGDGFTRALIYRVDADKNRWDDWREVYWIRRETKAGHFAKREYRVWPGQVQRGYQRAGLTPEMPKEDEKK